MTTLVFVANVLLQLSAGATAHCPEMSCDEAARLAAAACSYQLMIGSSCPAPTIPPHCQAVA